MDTSALGPVPAASEFGPEAKREGLTTAAVALGAAVAWMLALPWIIPLDAAIYRWIQFNWNVWVDTLAVVAEDVIFAYLAAIVIFAGSALLRRRSGELFETAAVVALGALVNETLKTIFERLRPQSVFTMVTGNSFPSGHIMNTTLVALAAVRLVDATEWPEGVKRACRMLAWTSVPMIALCRVARAGHWPSDVPPSILLGVAWFAIGPQLFRFRRRVLAAGLAAVLVVFAVFNNQRAIRFHLPSALGQSVPALRLVDFGEGDEGGVAFAGDWHFSPYKRGTVAWAVDREVRMDLGATPAAPEAVKLVVRPQSCGREDRQLAIGLNIFLNEVALGTVRLRRGWREYHFEIPPPARRADANAFRFTFEGAGQAECGTVNEPGFAAFRSLRLLETSRSRG